MKTKHEQRFMSLFQNTVPLILAYCAHLKAESIMLVMIVMFWNFLNYCNTVFSEVQTSEPNILPILVCYTRATHQKLLRRLHTAHESLQAENVRPPPAHWTTQFHFNGLFPKPKKPRIYAISFALPTFLHN